MIEPRPCPFCGAMPELFPKDPKRDGNAWGRVRCMNKNCPTFDARHSGGVFVDDGEDVNDERGSAAYIECAVKRWNQRI